MKPFISLSLCALFSLFVPAARAVDFDDTRPTSKYPLKFYDNDNRTIKEISAKNSTRSLDGTGLSGTAVDCGDHWQVTITGGDYYGRVFTDSGLSIILDNVTASIENENGSSALSASGGLSVCGPGVLYIDHDGNSPAVSTLKGGISVQDAAVVRVYNRGTGFAVKAAKGLDVNNSSLHVASPSGSGIVCYGDNENHPSYDAFSVSDSIVTVSSDGDAVVLRNMAPLEINYSSFHAVSATGIAIDDGNDVLGNGAPVYVGESVFVAIGGSEGLSCEGIKGSTDLWTHRPASLHFYDAIGIVAGGKVGVNGMDWITVVGETTKLVFAGNLDGLYSMTESFDAVEILSGNSSSGNAVFMRDKHASLFEQTAGHVTLFAPGTTGFARGEIQIGGGTLDVLNGCSIFEGYHSSDSLSLLNYEGSLFYVDGIVAASKTVSAYDVGDWANEDTDLSVALSQMRDIAYPILSSANKKKTAVGLACDTIRVARNDWRGGWMNIHVSSVGLAVETLAVADGVIDVYCPDSSRGIQVSKTFSKNFGSVCVNDESWPFAKPQPPATVKVSFDANGGTVSKKSVSFQAGGKIGTLPKPTRKGFVFAGWFTAKSGGAAVTAATKFSKNATIYARWAKPAYKIQFLANGGTGTMAVQKMKYGKAAKLKANKFKRKGHVFVGWSKTKNGKVAYANKKAVKNLTTKGGTVKLYASWAKTAYKVKFLPNGGTGKMSVQKMTYGKTSKLKANKFKRKGYDFLGWSKTKNGKVAYANKKIVKNLTTKGGTVKVYAKWGKRVKVTFEANGGTVKTKSKMATTDGTLGQIPTPTRENWNFDGWWTKRTGGELIAASTVIKKSMTVYAHWSPIISLTLDPNGGKATKTKLQCKTIATENGWFRLDTSLINMIYVDGRWEDAVYAPTRTGYGFIGWYTKKTGSKDLDALADFDLRFKQPSSLTLYADWEPLDWSVGLYYWWDVERLEPVFEWRYFKFGQPFGTLLPEPSRAGFVFQGWFTEEDGNGTQITASTVVNEKLPETIIAYWTPIQESWVEDW